jgi:hypothetical protein
MLEKAKIISKRWQILLLLLFASAATICEATNDQSAVGEINAALNGTKLRRLFLCRAEFIRPVAVGGYPHHVYIRDDRWNGNVVGRMNSTLQWA